VKVILYQPQIPQNTGNIVRTCAVTGCGLALVRPLGFSVSNRWLKRAGLDYWENVAVEFIDDLESYLSNLQTNFFFFSSKAQQLYTSVTYQREDVLIFGSETAGLPAHFFQKWPDRYIKIPMLPDTRCLNLATSVGIGVYEAIRQTGLL
jgi:tRNA (cytidine/uridine-2'-O-)-methyltransferase